MSVSALVRRPVCLVLLTVLSGCTSLGNVTWPGRENPTQTRTTAHVPSPSPTAGDGPAYKYDPVTMSPQDVPLEGDLQIAYANARKSLVERHRPDAAVTALTSAIESCSGGDGTPANETPAQAGPGLAYLYLLRGLCHASQQSYGAANQDLTEAIQLDEKLWQAYFHRSQILTAMNQPSLALQDANKGRQIAPVGAWINCSPNGEVF